MNIAAGVFLACLLHEVPLASSPMLPSSPSSSSFSSESSAWIIFRRFAPAVAILLGVLFSSYPEKNAGWTTWSHLLQTVGTKIFYSANEMSRDWSSIGALFIMLGTLYSQRAQWVLSNTILVWMGKVSFGVFLLHSMLIRSLLCWMLYYGKKPQKIRKEDGMLAFGYLQHRDGLAMWVAIAVFFAILYAFAWLWYVHVESWCGRICQKMEDAMFDKDAGRSGKSELPQ